MTVAEDIEMESVLMEKYRPGIQNGHDGGVPPRG